MSNARARTGSTLAPLSRMRAFLLDIDDSTIPGQPEPDVPGPPNPGDPGFEQPKPKEPGDPIHDVPVPMHGAPHPGV